MARIATVAALALTIAIAGCGGGSQASRSIKNAFSTHDGRPGNAAVSAGVPDAVACASKAQARRARASVVNRCVLPDKLAASDVGGGTIEARPGNARPNRKVPSGEELRAFRSKAAVSSPELVTGRFTGTTDQILRWAAAKWGYDPDIVRAVAYVESRWRMQFAGDGGVSHGLMQVKATAHPGTYPLSTKSTAFNVDYWAAVVRDYFDGRSAWLNDVERGQRYAAGDLWGSIGAWYAGRWHTANAEEYIREVKRALAQKPWRRPGF